MSDFMSYPEIKDDDFYEKIYLKKEFRDYEIKDKINWDKKKEIVKNFSLEPQQLFLRNYISPDTPYNGILIFHGTGVGKTCTAISIAEGFKKTLKNMNKRILVISNLKKNFENELYNFHKERTKKNPEDVVQCTGKAYELKEDSVYLSQMQKEKEIDKLKKIYYEFTGYQKFANYIIDSTGGWKGSDKDINEKIKRFISAKFDNRVIIIDEIQNMKTDKKDETKNIQPILESIIKYGKNIKLILMSATPMFDRPDEIIFYINLLLQNDGRKKIQRADIFNSKDGTLKLDADKKLREVFKGYVSYMRSEKPFTFPFRVYPKESIIPNLEYYMSGKKIELNKKLKYTKLIICPMQNIQLNTYIYYLEKKIKNGKIKVNLDNLNELPEESIDDSTDESIDEKQTMGMLHDLTKISIITYPTIKKSHNENYNSSEELNNIGSFSKSAIDTEYDNGNGGFYKSIRFVGKHRKTQYKYQSHAIFDKDTMNEAPFMDEKHLYKFSAKFDNILKTIKRSKGLSLVFSQFIEQATLSFALMLEQNGFLRHSVEGEEERFLLDYNRNKYGGGGKREPICYLCSNKINHISHQNNNNSDYHIFKQAKYILYFGSTTNDIVKIKRDEALKKFCSENNKYGEEIKVFIGTRTISEGLDFKRLRQVHIIEPWYNLSRHEQIIGRAIRNLSHRDLLEEERNVEIYQYASIINDTNIESVDIKNYRIAENKDVIIKNIGRIMKESAVDCVLFRNTNIIESTKTVQQITSSGEILNIPIADKPYSAICDYKEKCNYTCNWMINPRQNYPINTDTYNIRFAADDIEKIKKNIKTMFRENIVYHLDLIENNILKIYPEINKLFIYSALETLVDNKNEVIYDKFSRKGYIIYRGDYYVFQPFDLERDDIPLIYRIYPSDIKPDHVDLESISLNYSNKNIINNTQVINEQELIKNIFVDIENTYILHLKISNNKTYLYSVIGMIIDNLSNEYKYIFIKYILTNYLQDSKIKYINDIINYLDLTKKLINYYSHISYNKSKIKDGLFVGFIIFNQYYIIDKINKNINITKLKYNTIIFENCSKDLIYKIKSYSNILTKKNNKDYNIIYGIIEYDAKNDTKKFKIADKSLQEKILTKEKKMSKRSIITGRICSTYQLSKLKEIRTKIGMYGIETKIGGEFICKDLELYFRYKQLSNNDNKIWLDEIYV
jgi:hypothetical protein